MQFMPKLYEMMPGIVKMGLLSTIDTDVARIRGNDLQVEVDESIELWI
jgi:hypothetical protein